MALRDIGIGRRAPADRRGSRRRIGHLEPVRAPFDAPFENGYAGVRYTEGALVTVLAVAPGPPRPRLLDSSWFAVDPHAARGAAGLPLGALLQWLHRPEAAATSITVTTRGGGCPGDGPAPAAYRSLLGPLPVAAHRSVHLTVGTDPLRHPGLTARYGTGPAAALRACLASTRRVAAILRGAGISAVPLTAAQITAAGLTAAKVSSPGVHRFDDDPRRTPLQLYSVNAHDGETLCTAMESAWRITDGIAECALDLRSGADGPAVSATIRPAGPMRAAAPPEWVPLDGGEPPVLPDPTAHDLTGALPPIGGDGVIAGADPGGRPVGLRLAGTDIGLAHVSGDLDLIRRLVVRLTATGHSTAVFTDRPEHWAGLLDAVADPGMLHAAADGRGQVLLDDRPGARLGPLEGHTILRVHDRAGAGPEPADDAPAVRQDRGDPAFAEVSGGGRRIRVRLVATPAEDALLGRG